MCLFFFFSTALFRWRTFYPSTSLLLTDHQLWWRYQLFIRIHLCVGKRLVTGAEVYILHYFMFNNAFLGNSFKASWLRAAFPLRQREREILQIRPLHYPYLFHIKPHLYLLLCTASEGMHSFLSLHRLISIWIDTILWFSRDGGNWNPIYLIGTKVW